MAFSVYLSLPSILLMIQNDEDSQRLIEMYHQYKRLMFKVAQQYFPHDKELLRQIASTDPSDLVREIAKLHCSYTGPEPFYPREPDEEFEQSVKLFLEQRVAPADQPAGTEGKHPAPYRVIKPDKQNPVKRNRV